MNCVTSINGAKITLDLSTLLIRCQSALSIEPTYAEKPVISAGNTRCIPVHSRLTALTLRIQ